jgi:hypothetical protein
MQDRIEIHADAIISHLNKRGSWIRYPMETDGDVLRIGIVGVLD